MDDLHVNQKAIYGLNSLINETVAGLRTLDTLFGFQPGLPLKVYFNYHNIAELFKILANDYVDNFSVYSKNYCKSKELLTHCHPTFDTMLEKLLPDSCCPNPIHYQKLREYVLLYIFADVFDGVHGFVASTIVTATWQVYSVELVGSSLILSKGQDYRVMEYYRLIEKYEPKAAPDPTEPMEKPQTTIYDTFPNIASSVISDVVSLLGEINAELWLQSMICKRYNFYPAFMPEDLAHLKRASLLKRKDFLINFGFGWENNNNRG